MKSLFSSSSQKPLHILVVGNNPIEMSAIIDTIKQVRKRKIITEIAFDIRSALERLVNFKPNFILIDDNLGKLKFKETVQTFSTARRTKDVPITVLKTSNYREISASPGILDYLLKQNLSADSLYGTIRNSIRLKRTQRLLQRAYRRTNRWMGVLAREKSNLVS